jgi:hypothetical protein
LSAKIRTIAQHGNGKNSEDKPELEDKWVTHDSGGFQSIIRGESGGKAVEYSSKRPAIPVNCYGQVTKTDCYNSC